MHIIQAQKKKEIDHLLSINITPQTSSDSSAPLTAQQRSWNKLCRRWDSPSQSNPCRCCRALWTAPCSSGRRGSCSCRPWSWPTRCSCSCRDGCWSRLCRSHLRKKKPIWYKSFSWWNVILIRQNFRIPLYLGSARNWFPLVCPFSVALHPWSDPKCSFHQSKGQLGQMNQHLDWRVYIWGPENRKC